MKAHLSISGWLGDLYADLETGERIVENNPAKLAEQLRAAGVTANSLTVTDFKTAPDHAPTTGQIIAMKALLQPDLNPVAAERIKAQFESE